MQDLNNIMLLKIITFRDQDSGILFRPTGKIEVFDKKLAELAEDVKETLLENDGLGLAAPQINNSIALCVIRTGKKVQYFCNPEIVESSSEEELMEEGCLSFPNIFLDVNRPKSIKIIYQDLKGNSKKLDASGILARTLQHEIDHLNGIAFIERV